MADRQQFPCLQASDIPPEMACNPTNLPRGLLETEQDAGFSLAAPSSRKTQAKQRRPVPVPPSTSVELRAVALRLMPRSAKKLGGPAESDRRRRRSGGTE
jgi:hypothetical protein